MAEFVTSTGQHLVNVHDAESCVGPCPIHRPSAHHMRDWPLHWRGDMPWDIASGFERICLHGVGHPDPDTVHRAVEYHEDLSAGVHGCDGCCAPPAPERRNEAS